jgi:hypothetical protein
MVTLLASAGNRSKWCPGKCIWAIELISGYKCGYRDQNAVYPPYNACESLGGNQTKQST